MTQLRIEEWQNHYHPGVYREIALEQFEKIRSMVLDQALEKALQRLNLSDRELICIREIRVPVYLRLSSTAQSQAACWSLAIVKQIQQQSNSNNEQSVVRYQSRGHAWISCAEAVLKGEYRESWAWQQTEMIAIDETVSQEFALSELFAALASEPGYLLPVINALWVKNLFDTLLLSTCDKHWCKVQEILEQSFNTRVTEIFFPQDDIEYPFEAINKLLDARRPVQRMAEMHISGTLAKAGQLNLQSRQTIALVILALDDPGILCRSPDIVRQTFKIQIRNQKLISLPEVDEQIINASGPDKPLLDTVSHRQQLLAKEKSTTADLLSIGGRQGLKKIDKSMDDKAFDGNQQYRSENLGTGLIQPSEDAIEQISREKAVTGFGGLLYLLNLLEHPCALVDILSRSHCFNQRSMVWVWLHLAVSIMPAELDDPAVLAFAGLIPGKPLDEDLCLSPDDAEQQHLDRYATEIMSAAQDSLESVGSNLSVNMDRLYRRRAVITSDLGWIEVEFSLNDVDTGIRRAGLDIDPGFLSWLSVVMRFKYA